MVQSPLPIDLPIVKKIRVSIGQRHMLLVATSTVRRRKLKKRQVMCRTVNSYMSTSKVKYNTL